MWLPPQSLANGILYMPPFTLGKMTLSLETAVRLLPESTPKIRLWLSEIKTFLLIVLYWLSFSFSVFRYIARERRKCPIKESMFISHTKLIIIYIDLYIEIIYYGDLVKNRTASPYLTTWFQSNELFSTLELTWLLCQSYSMHAMGLCPPASSSVRNISSIRCHIGRPTWHRQDLLSVDVTLAAKVTYIILY